MSKLKFVSWNCHYGFDGTKQKAIMEACPDADIFVIHECYYSDSVSFAEANKFAYHEWYGDGKDSCLGIGVFSKTHKVELHSDFDYRKKFKFRYVVPYSIECGSNKITLFAAWTKEAIDGDKNCHNLAYDDNLGEACKTYLSLLRQRAIVMGDFNTASNDRDNEHKQRYTALCKKLSGLLDCANEVDRGKNTFYSDREKAMFRDDFCFVSPDLKDKASPKQTVLDDGWENGRWRGLSDHCPIIVELELP